MSKRCMEEPSVEPSPKSLKTQVNPLLNLIVKEGDVTSFQDNVVLGRYVHHVKELTKADVDGDFITAGGGENGLVFDLFQDTISCDEETDSLEMGDYYKFCPELGVYFHPGGSFTIFLKRDESNKDPIVEDLTPAFDVGRRAFFAKNPEFFKL